MHYEVQQHTPTDDWTNNWFYNEGDGIFTCKPSRHATKRKPRSTNSSPTSTKTLQPGSARPVPATSSGCSSYQTRRPPNKWMPRQVRHDWRT